MRIPALLEGPSQSIERTPSNIADDFLRANPGFTARSVVVICSGQDVPRLREIRFCLGRDLTPRACSADSVHAACRADTLIVPPIR